MAWASKNLLRSGSRQEASRPEWPLERHWTEPWSARERQPIIRDGWLQLPRPPFCMYAGLRAEKTVGQTAFSQCWPQDCGHYRIRQHLC